MVSLNLEKVLRPPEEPIDGLEGEDLQEAVKAWFLSNFEDPAQETPYNGKEGGYQWIWGGPYDAREEIEDYFGSSVPQHVIDAVVSDLERDAIEWAPHGSRIYDEDPPDEELGEEYVHLQSALDELEEVLNEVNTVPAAIGGNNPPEEIGVPPYGDEDKVGLTAAIATLRQPEVLLLTEKRKEAIQAAETIGSFRERIVEFLKKHGGIFAESFSKKLGEASATAIVGLGVWVVLGDKLAAVFQAAKTLIGF